MAAAVHSRCLFTHLKSLSYINIKHFFLKVTWNTAYMQHLNSWPCCLPHASFPGSEPRVRWPQQSRDQRCLPARQQSPDLHRWERHQHPAVGGRLGNSIHPTSLIPHSRGPASSLTLLHLFTVLPSCHQGAVSPLCLLGIKKKIKKKDYTQT